MDHLRAGQGTRKRRAFVGWVRQEPQAHRKLPRQYLQKSKAEEEELLAPLVQ
jgi:hypothetical protein